MSKIFTALHSIGAKVHADCFQEVVNIFTNQLSFRIIGYRTSSAGQQLAIKNDELIFILGSERTDVLCKDVNPVDAWLTNKLPVNVATQKGISAHVSEISFHVSNLSHVLENVEKSGGRILRDVSRIDDESGRTNCAIIQPCIGNITHTIFERISQNSTSSVLPIGFKSIPKEFSAPHGGDKKLQVNSLDHITYACEPGTSLDVIQFYTNCFDCQRRMISIDDDVETGLTITGDDVGLRLMAAEYPELAACPQDDESRVSLVLAEPLPQTGINQVSQFLDSHSGGGVQHIAISTDDIVTSARNLHEHGIKLNATPAAYYNNVDKLRQIVSCGFNVSDLAPYGILIDTEESSDGALSQLLQVFTEPLFSSHASFFLELIQREGGRSSRSLGVSNIKALWDSVQQQQREQEQRTTVVQ